MDKKQLETYGKLRELWKSVAYDTLETAKEIIEETGSDAGDIPNEKAALLIDALLVKAFAAGQQSTWIPASKPPKQRGLYKVTRLRPGEGEKPFCSESFYYIEEQQWMHDDVIAWREINETPYSPGQGSATEPGQ